MLRAVEARSSIQMRQTQELLGQQRFIRLTSLAKTFVTFEVKIDEDQDTKGYTYRFTGNTSPPAEAGLNYTLGDSITTDFCKLYNICEHISSGWIDRILGTVCDDSP